MLGPVATSVCASGMKTTARTIKYSTNTSPFVSRGATEIARTNAAGVAAFELQGSEGDTIGVDVACPPGFKSPAAPVPVRLRRLSDPKERAEYDVDCPPTTRKVVVAVRANNG